MTTEVLGYEPQIHVEEGKCHSCSLRPQKNVRDMTNNPLTFTIFLPFLYVKFQSIFSFYKINKIYREKVSL